jgi:hypothetical protein
MGQSISRTVGFNSSSGGEVIQIFLHSYRSIINDGSIEGPSPHYHFSLYDQSIPLIQLNNP